jgi:PAS domain S-box-containing protein
MQDRFRVGRQSYIIPHAYKEIWEGRLDTYHTRGQYVTESDEGCWDEDDLCFSPLYDSEQRLIGVISVDNPRDGRVPTQRTMETLELFANQAAAIVENARLHAEMQKRLQEQIALREASTAISSVLDQETVLTSIVEQMGRTVHATSAYLCDYAPKTREATVLAEYISPQACAEEQASDLGATYLEDSGGEWFGQMTAGRHDITHVDDSELTESDLAHMREFGAKTILYIPLRIKGEFIGYVELWESRQRRDYTPEEIALCHVLAQQAAVALENAQLFGEARQQADRLRAINQVGVEIASILKVDQLVARVTELVEESLGYYASIALIEDDYLVWRSYEDQEDGRSLDASPDEETRPRRIGDRGITGWAVESGQTVIVPEASEDELHVSEPGLEGGVTRSEVAIPLKVQDRIIGVFNVQSKSRETFSENDVLVLQSLANQAAAAIANAQLFEHVSQFRQELERRVQERTEALAKTLEDLTLERDRVETLYRITRELSASLDLDRVLAEALSLINRAVGVSHGSILLLNPGTGNLVYRAALGRSRGLPRGGKPTRYSRGVGLAGWVLETREPAIVSDVDEDSRWIPDEKKSTPERKSAMAVPLTAGDDVLGVLLLFHPEIDYFTDDHLKLVSAAAAQVATAINNAELYQLITDQAERLGVMLRTQRAEAAKLQAIVEGIADGVLVLDVNRRVMLMNPAASRILGLGASAIEGRHLREILGRAESAIDQELAQRLYSRLMVGAEHLIARESSEAAEVSDFAFRVQAEEKVVVVSLSPALLSSGEQPSLVAVVRDISREAEVERLKNEFISTVSHELRTPMTSIKGYTDLLVSERMGELSEQQRHFVGVIKNNADRLTALVNDILDISRIETGRLKLQMEPLDLCALIEGVVDNFEGQMVEKSLQLTLDLPTSLPPVRGDKDRVIQILENLTSNAWKYTPEGGKVTIQAKASDGSAQVDVIDTGIGIEEKDLPHIFDRFYRTEQAEVQALDGSGLGLSIVRMFVQLLGGKIWAKSEVDKGSIFSFTLPLAVDTTVPSSTGVDATGPKVLVVDDDEHIVQLLRHQLEMDGYRVLTAQRGEDVLGLARGEQPALITLDVLLNGMDGFEVLEQLKEDPVTSSIPVIVVSVVPDAETRGLALGAAGYIGKPFEESQVLSRVQQVLSPLDSGEGDQLNRVLVVDDDSDIVDWLKVALTNSGFAVQGAYNGHEALALAREDSPDLILLDLKMPDMDGYEVIRRLRGQKSTRDIPVIVITGISIDDDFDQVEILGMGVEHLLTKPFTVETLVEEIKRVEYNTADQS